MWERHDDDVRQLALTHGWLPPERLDALCRQEGSGRPAASLATRLLETGWVSRRTLLRAAAESVGREWTEGLPESLGGALAATFSAPLARRLGVVPRSVEADAAEFAGADPFEFQAEEEELAFSLGRDVRIVMADPLQVGRLLDRHYAGSGATGALLSQEHAPAVEALAAAESVSTPEELAQLAGQPPVIRYVRTLLERAVREGAADLHFEPWEEGLRVRARVDGALREYASPARSLSLAVLSRLKVMAHLDIAERRLPQDGRLRLMVEGRSVDLRVSTVTTSEGESAVLRVLDRQALSPGWEALKMPALLETKLREQIARPAGFILVTGPTGSGKTTTLYRCLREIVASGRKVLAAEDPVEYELEGAQQVSVRPEIGLTFATALRTFLRNDPDVLFIGEIRDRETAQRAAQAALTGHLVLSTLHTGEAVAAPARLADLGVEPYLVSASLEAVLAQRLVRRLCQECRQPYEPDARSLPEHPRAVAAEAGTLFRARGCAACGHTGYRGRVGLYELWLPSRRARERMARLAGVQELRAQALAEGHLPLRADAARLLLAGETTPEEIALALG